MQTTAQSGDVRETHSLIASDKVEGTPVRRSDGEKIGTIERVMIEKRSGKVAYAVMSFGGFMGLGEEYYTLPWGVLKYNTELDAYELNLTEDQLRGAPRRTRGGARRLLRPRVGGACPPLLQRHPLLGRQRPDEHGPVTGPTPQKKIARLSPGDFFMRMRRMKGSLLSRRMRHGGLSASTSRGSCERSSTRTAWRPCPTSSSRRCGSTRRRRASSVLELRLRAAARPKPSRRRGWSCGMQSSWRRSGERERERAEASCAQRTSWRPTWPKSSSAAVVLAVGLLSRAVFAGEWSSSLPTSRRTWSPTWRRSSLRPSSSQSVFLAAAFLADLLADLPTADRRGRTSRRVFVRGRLLGADLAGLRALLRARRAARALLFFAVFSGAGRTGVTREQHRQRV